MRHTYDVACPLFLFHNLQPAKELKEKKERKTKITSCNLAHLCVHPNTVQEQLTVALALQALDGPDLTRAQGKTLALRAKKAVKIVAEDPNTKRSYTTMWRHLKAGEAQQAQEIALVITENLQQYLETKERKSRTARIKENVSRRSDRFKSSDRTQLKLVINSIMQKYKTKQDITSAMMTAREPIGVGGSL